jgi:malate/lactate dehydrogenase
MKIAIIGAGNLGLSIAKGLVYNNTYTSLYLTKRNLDSIKKNGKTTTMSKSRPTTGKPSKTQTSSSLPYNLDNSMVS